MVCPLCGGQIVRGRANWGCMGYVNGCTLRIPFTVDGYTLTDADARALLTKGRTSKISFADGEGKLVLRDGKTERVAK